MSKKLINLLRHGGLHREDDGAIEFWRIKIIFRSILCILNIGLMQNGRAAWQEEEETIKKISIVLILREKFFPSELFKVIQDAILLILFTRQCLDSGQFLRVHLSRWMCNQFTFHHQFRIDTGRSKFEQSTDNILSACGSYGQRTQGSRKDRLESTASCTIHT